MNKVALGIVLGCASILCSGCTENLAVARYRVKGRLVGSNGEPLIGVPVKVSEWPVKDPSDIFGVPGEGRGGKEVNTDSMGGFEITIFQKWCFTTVGPFLLPGALLTAPGSLDRVYIFAFSGGRWQERMFKVGRKAQPVVGRGERVVDIGTVRIEKGI